MSISLSAELTNEARGRFANMTVSGRSFVIEEFATGSGGHDPNNPTLSLTPDVSITELPQQTFGPKAITSKEMLDISTAKIVITLGSTEAVGVLSNIVLVARINYSPIPNDPQINTKFAFAIANMPMQNKLAGEERVYEIVINY